MASEAARRSGRAVRRSVARLVDERRSTSLGPTAFSPGQALHVGPTSAGIRGSIQVNPGQQSYSYFLLPTS
jgi:hypothetical protein